MNIISEELIKNPNLRGSRIKGFCYLSDEMCSFMKLEPGSRYYKYLVYKAVYVYILENNLYEEFEIPINNNGFNVIKVKINPDCVLIGLLEDLSGEDKYYTFKNLGKYLSKNFNNS